MKEQMKIFTSNELSALDNMSVRMINCDFKRWNKKRGGKKSEDFSKLNAKP